ncbi:hypothetical protein FHS16_003321 [Paenibacillus endophyticus]|uniref:Uncharacterized protein n=1 Tax=Paenibacillus endophyticus TaxID=1294268 RepID=A0A7W5CAQ9_9BACL|nr:hypothetical protein [Paenibacillus endophyticus]
MHVTRFLVSEDSTPPKCCLSQRMGLTSLLAILLFKIPLFNLVPHRLIPLLANAPISLVPVSALLSYSYSRFFPQIKSPLHLRFNCGLSAVYLLRLICIQSAFLLRFICIQTAFLLHLICVSSTFNPRFFCISSAFHLRSFRVSSAFHMHFICCVFLCSICVLSVFYLRSICVLSVFVSTHRPYS